jgi:hypothetical protein
MSFIYMVAIPGALTWLAYKTEVCSITPMAFVMTKATQEDEDGIDSLQGKYELRGKRKGDTISEW